MLGQFIEAFGALAHQFDRVLRVAVVQDAGDQAVLFLLGVTGTDPERSADRAYEAFVRLRAMLDGVGIGSGSVAEDVVGEVAESFFSAASATWGGSPRQASTSQ
jgi:hypothetical protein